jgi:ankyrin repeat protein
VVSLLLSAGANPNARDNLGSSALLEAVKAGQAPLLGLLVGAGAALQLSNSELSSALCSMVVEEQEGLLRRYIAAGANVTAGDYNQQTPLHIAAVQGKLEMVRHAMPAFVARALLAAVLRSLRNIFLPEVHKLL